MTEVRRKPSRYGGVKGQEVKGQSALKLRVHESKKNEAVGVNLLSLGLIETISRCVHL